MTTHLHDPDTFTSNLIDVLAEAGFDPSDDNPIDWIRERTYANREVHGFVDFVNVTDDEVILVRATLNGLVHGECRFPLSDYGLAVLAKAVAR